MTSKAEIRRSLRHRRRSLEPRERRQRDRRLARVLMRSAVFRRARRIALYLSNDGEPDLEPLLEPALGLGKRLYLPVLAPLGGHRLWFRRYRPGESAMAANRYGIAEPARRGNARVPLRSLDLVLAPLVAYDGAGHRLGMGGGYYDRSFAFLHHRRRWQHPRIIGIAYDFQQVDALPAEPWDVPLWGVATDAGLRRFNNKREQR